MPMQPTIPPVGNIKLLAQGLANGIDAFTKKIPMAPVEILAAIEFIRYSYTEAIIDKRNNENEKG